MLRLCHAHTVRPDAYGSYDSRPPGSSRTAFNSQSTCTVNEVKTLIIGFGNPILCDDGVGNHIAKALAKRINRSDVTIIETSSAGLDIVDLLPGYDKVIIIDAIMTGKGKPGLIHRLSSSELNSTLHSVSLHDISLGSAIELGKRLGNRITERITIFGIEVQNIDTFSDTCTVEVQSAVPECIGLILNELD